MGALKNAGHSDEEAKVYSEGVRRGETLISARVQDNQITEAEAALDRNGAVDASTRGEAYRGAGWSPFDDKAPAYTTEKIERERATYRGETSTL